MIKFLPVTSLQIPRFLCAKKEVVTNCFAKDINRFSWKSENIQHVSYALKGLRDSKTP